MRKRTGDRPVAGFNLVAVAGTEGLCLHYDGVLRPAPFGPGAHVVSTDRDLDDPAMPEKQAFDRFLAALAGPPDERALASFLASHEGGRPICRHGDRFGTVSSTIHIRTASRARLLYADGPPCRTPFAEIPLDRPN